MEVSKYCACLHMDLCSDGDHAYEDHETTAKDVFRDGGGGPCHVKVVQDVLDGGHELEVEALLDDDVHRVPGAVSLELL